MGCRGHIYILSKRDSESNVLKKLRFRPGPFIDIETGKVVGEHTGVHLWTNGQRIRLGRQGPQLGGRHNKRG